VFPSGFYSTDNGVALLRTNTWRNWLARTFRPSKTAPIRRRVVPRLESLEDRIVPSIPSVTGMTIAPTEGIAFSGAVATFTSPDAGSFSASINWGDGTTTSGTVSGSAGNFTVSGSHTYAEDGAESVPVVITDSSDATTATATATANVGERSFVLFGVSPITVTEGAAFSGTVAMISDPGSPDAASAFSATIDWGDGATDAGTVTGVTGSGSFTITGSHTYADELSGQINVTASEGTFFTFGPNPDSVTVAEADVLTAGTPGFFFSPPEGPTFSYSSVPFTDTNTTNTAADFTGTINWGDGTTTAGNVTGGSGSFLVGGVHAYADEGSFNVVFTLTDNAPGAASASETIGAVVGETDSLTGTGLTVTALEQNSFSGAVATFTDTNTNALANDFAATINWGDGTTTAGTVSGGTGGPFSVNGTHTYAEDGAYSPAVTLTDDAPGTATATATGAATVSEADPTVTRTAATGTVTEGVSASGTLVTFTDPGSGHAASAFTATVDWGDGTTTSGTITGAGPTFTVSGSHTWADEGTDNIVVTVTETGVTPTADDSAAPQVITVLENDTLTVNPIQATFPSATEGQSFSGRVANFVNFNAANTTPADFTVTIDWGDGTTTGGVLSNPGATNIYAVDGTHTYADEGTYTVVVTVADDAPGTANATATNTATVAEGDVLTVNPIQPTPSPTEGVSFSGRVANFVNTNAAANTPADFTATIDWGDGTTSSGTLSNPGGNIYAVDGTHTYADEGAFTVSVTLADDAPGTASATASNAITVAEGDVLTVNLIQPTPIPTEGVSFSGRVANFVNTNAANTTPADFTATINWGDGTSSSGTVSNPAATNIYAVAGTHTYADEGSFTVVVTVADDAPGTASATASNTVTVVEGDTLSATLAAVSPTEGTAFSGAVAIFSDTDTSNTAGDFTATINWGDGTTTAGTVSGGSGAFTVSGGHTYADEASFTAKVVLTDDAPGTAKGTAAGAVGVAEADALSGSATPIQTTEGTAVTEVATFTDTFKGNTAADFTATINWGDGTTTAGTVSGAAGNFTVTGAHTYTSSGPFAVGVALKDDAPGTASALAATTASISGGVVVTDTTGGKNLTIFRTTPGGPVGNVTYVLGNTPPVVLTHVHSFTYNGQGAGDSMTVKYANGEPLVTAGLFFNGGAAPDTLNIVAAGLPLRTVPGLITAGDVAPETTRYTGPQAIFLNAAAVDAFAGPDIADRDAAFASLNPQERFVQALYLDELGRAGSKAELDAWTQVFTSGGTQIQDQATIASDIQQSVEARDHLVKSWYLAFLGRAAQGGEEQGWVNLLLQGQSEEQVLSGILGSPEFYGRAQTLIGSGSADERYVQALYLLLLNRTGEPAGVAAWVGGLAQVGRQGVALAFLTGVSGREFRTAQFEGYYNALLHRPDDLAGLNNWVMSNLDVGAARVGFESSLEYFIHG
jgi:hypothetical protein